MRANVQKPHVYSILFMRDDSRVTRFRIRAIWFKLLLFLFMVGLLGAGASVWAVHYYWQRYEFHKEEARGMDAALKENQHQLERLSGLEKFLEDHDPVLLRTIMSSVAVPDSADPARPPEGDPETGGDPTDDPAPADGSTVPSGTETTPGTVADGQGNGTAATPAPGMDPPPDGTPGDGQGSMENGANGADGAATDGGGTETPAATPDTPPPPHPVRLSNIQVRPSASRIFVAFDLGNQDSNEPLSGRVSLALVGGDGKVAPISNASSESGLRFTQIARYKPISATIPLPQGMAMADIAAVRVSVDTEGNPAFVQRFPMPIQH